MSRHLESHKIKSGRRGRNEGRGSSDTSRRAAGKRWLLAGVGVLGFTVAGLLAAVFFVHDESSRARQRAEAATRSGRWTEALKLWRHINATHDADAHSFRSEAKACLALGRAAQAQHALEQAAARDPSGPEAWLIQLEIARIENRLPDALAVGRRALAAASPDARREVLRGFTLALLAEAPDDLARATLKRWIESDPLDLVARAALERRISEYPRSHDPPVQDRVAALERLVAEYPEHLDLREALILVVAEAGNPARGSQLLDSWPRPQRDARYHRLRGRWDLEYDQNPQAAVESLQRALDALPHDTKTRYRLARALQASGRAEEARQMSASVARMREVLEPVRLGRRLDAALANLAQPAARRDLADLCDSLDLKALAKAWREDSESFNHSMPSHGKSPR